MRVDVSKVPGCDAHRIGSTYQYIGEVDRTGTSGGGGGGGGDAPGPVLRARVARCVDGLDGKLYDLALSGRNQFLYPPRRSKSQPAPQKT